MQYKVTKYCKDEYRHEENRCTLRPRMIENNMP